MILTRLTYRLFTLLLLGSAGLAVCPASAQVTANASFSPESVETGDTFSLRILVTGSRVAPKAVDLRSWYTRIPADNFLKQYGWQRSGDQWVRRYTLIAFDSANLNLPPLKVVTHLGDTVPTNPLQLLVSATPAPSDVNAMANIRGIRRTEGIDWSDFLPLTLGAMVLLIFGIWYMRRKKTPPPPPPVVQTAPVAVEDPPHSLALRALEKLAAEKSWEKGEITAFYNQLGQILRICLEKGHGIAAPESTTRETVQLLKKAGFSPENVKNIETVLLRTDLVKYAHFNIDPKLHPQSLDTAIRIIRNLQTAIANPQ